MNANKTKHFRSLSSDEPWPNFRRLGLHTAHPYVVWLRPGKLRHSPSRSFASIRVHSRSKIFAAWEQMALCATRCFV